MKNCKDKNHKYMSMPYVEPKPHAQWSCCKSISSYSYTRGFKPTKTHAKKIYSNLQCIHDSLVC